MTNKNYTKDKTIINLKKKFGTLSVPYPCNPKSKTKQVCESFEQEYEYENNFSKPLLFDRKKTQKNLSFNYITTFLELPRPGPGRQSRCNYFRPNINPELKHSNYIDDYSCERRKIKKLHGVGCMVANDQKKRTRFEKCELKNIVFKSLIKSNPNLNTCKKIAIGEKKLSKYESEAYPVEKQVSNSKLFFHLQSGSSTNEELRIRKKAKLFASFSQAFCSTVYCYKFLSLNDTRVEFKDFSNHLPLGPRLKFQVVIVKNISMASCSKVRNRCILTGHASCLRGFGLSRISFRKYAALGLIPGVEKAINK